MTRFSRLTLMGITLLASLTAAACQSDERSPTAPAAGSPAPGVTTRGVAPGMRDLVTQSFTWYGADGHQYSVQVTGDQSRHFQDGQEYGDITADDATIIDGGTIIYDQLLGSPGAGPMAVRGGSQVEDERAPVRPRPQGQTVAPCSAEIGSYLEASTTMIAAAAYYKMSRTTKAKLAFAAAVVSWVNSWRALYACESANVG